MPGLKPEAHKNLVITIVDRGVGDKVAEAFKSDSHDIRLVAMGLGTASSVVLSRLGLGESEKEVLMSIVPTPEAADSLARVKTQFHMDRPGHGVAFAIPLKGEGLMDQRFPYELIIAVSTKGFAEDVMETARRAGARGGTIVHARGVGSKETEMFFGIAIHPEKEMLLILADAETAPIITKAIADEKGVATEAHTVVFTLPVSDAVGLLGK